MRKVTYYPIVILVLSTSIWLTACERTLTGIEKANVLAFSEAITDNMFDGLMTTDYAVFSRDFDVDMSERVPATDFAAWKQEFDNQMGDYLARRVDQVSQSDEFFVVVYQAKFEQVEDVTVTVAFHASNSIAFCPSNQINIPGRHGIRVT